MITNVSTRTRILERDRWPLYPVLPLKRYIDDRVQLAFLLADNVLKVYHGNIGCNPSTISRLPTTTYSNIDELLAVWQVD